MARSSCPRSCARTWAWSASHPERDELKGPAAIPTLLLVLLLVLVLVLDGLSSTNRKRGSSMSITIVKPPPAKIKDTGVHPRRWTRKEYHRAAELGLFRPD